MKLTHERLKQIIKEELEEMISEKPKTIEDVVLGTYQGKEYAADEDKMNPNNFQLFEPTAPFMPIEPIIVIPKHKFQTDWGKTEIERIKAKPPMPPIKSKKPKKQKFFI